MAIAETIHLKEAVRKALRATQNERGNSPNKLNGVYLLTGYKDIIPDEYDLAGDIIRFFQFPFNARILSGSLISSGEWDTGGSALRVDLILDVDEDEENPTVAYTTGVAGAGNNFGSQPENDAVELISDNALDTANVTVFGTTFGTNDFVSETIALNGVSVVTTVKTDWGKVLGVLHDSGLTGPNGTLTVRKATGDGTICALFDQVAQGIEGAPLSDLGITDFSSEYLRLSADTSSSKTIGISGTDNLDNPIDDAIVLNDANQVLSHIRFTGVDSVYVGDLVSGTHVSIGTGKVTLVEDFAGFSSDPSLAMNYIGGDDVGSEIGVSVGETYLALKIVNPPTTASSTSVRLTYKILVYVGPTSVIIP